MKDFEHLGHQLRDAAKDLVIEFMNSSKGCRPGENGMTQTDIFKKCGFDWGNYEKAPSTNQQYWVIAALRELAKEKKIEQVSKSGPWRLLR